MDIDLVYNYVNGSDEEWVSKRNAFALDCNNSEVRFRDNGELMFSLRSVEKYAPWIRKIYVLIDSRPPDWLNTENDRLVLVYHKDFMPEELLPCYNSNVIEYFLDSIPGLSEVFLYANDDMFFGREVPPCFFVADGKPLVRMISMKVEPAGYYGRALYNSRQLMLERFGTAYDLLPIHNIDVYSKTAIRECKAEFAAEFEQVSKNRMRQDNDLQRSIFHCYMIEKGLCSLKTYPYYPRLAANLADTARTALFPSKHLDFLTRSIHDFFNTPKGRLYFARNPRLVCLNDSDDTTEEELRKYRALMLKKFPEKSSFEK